MNHHIKILILLPLGILALHFPLLAKQTSKPNFLIIMADDATMRDMEVYGGQARTPNINALAKEGMKFNYCFQATAMCATTRTNLLTGIYPVRNGAFRNHSKAHSDMKSIVQHLKPLGYQVGLVGKRHIAPNSVFPFEYCTKDKVVDLNAADQFIDKSKGSENPFCLFIMSTDPHVPWTKGDPSSYPPDKLKMPPHLIDTPETRKAYSRYLAELTYFDKQVGDSLDILKEHGLENDTMVIVLSEHGNLFPFEKWTCYDGGLQSAMIVRFPGRIKADSETDAMVEYVDVVPTIVDIAGGEPIITLDGKSFKDILTGEATSHKDVVFGVQTTMGINGCTQPFGSRSIRNNEYKLIINTHPENQFTNATIMNPKDWSERRRDYLGWIKSWRNKSQKNPRDAFLLKRYLTRPAIEFYKVNDDPYELNNLADNPEYNNIKVSLSKKLYTWMESQGDKGKETEEGAKIKKKNKKKI